MRRVTALEICAITAAILILISPFVYRWRIGDVDGQEKSTKASFSGTPSCKECHKDIFAKWQDSDHDKAMEVATEETVLANFNNVNFVDPYSRKVSRFFKEDGKFKIETEGPDGETGIFTISHTFGFYPLQQYLVPFPGGKLQCLSIAWDVEKKEWYRLPPYNVEDHSDWLHWTKGGQTWNGMCAECHSTRLQKKFDLEKENYSTSWFEINVGCEACHGPGSKHVEWAAQPVMARTEIENFGLIFAKTTLSSEKQIVLCAPCHSRRYQLGDNDHTNTEILDFMVPTLLVDGLYYADGQILEEVYVYGSFVQSKMYQHDVKCSDCHDSHSLKPHRENNELCLQCHRGSEYDSPRHHFHKKEYKGKPSDGYLCVKCHMPGRYYMGIDYRPDHSIRIPRPDMSEKLGTPNSCSTADCHGDKPLEWVMQSYTKWYGESRKSHYGEVLTAARNREEEGLEKLIGLIEDELLPPIVRATGLTLLANYPGQQTTAAIEKALFNNDPLIRQTALRALGQPDEKTILKIVAPKLYDPVKAVRIEAALMLAKIPEEKIKEQDRESLQHNLQEYRNAMVYNGDFAPQRYNLGNLESTLGNLDKAKEYYRAAIKIDNQFMPAKVNLAMAFNQEGKNKEAEQLLREVVIAQPQMFEVSYSLGLLLSEIGDFEEAAHYLGRAAEGMPQYTRARYNYALALLKLKRWQEGINAMKMAVLQEPQVGEYFITLVKLYLNFNMKDQARILAEEVLQAVPDHGAARKVLQMIK